MKKKTWLGRNIYEIKQTIFPDNPDDTPSKRMGKKIGWIMFILIMLCCSVAMLIAVSFAH